MYWFWGDFGQLDSCGWPKQSLHLLRDRLLSLSLSLACLFSQPLKDMLLWLRSTLDFCCWTISRMGTLEPGAFVVVTRPSSIWRRQRLFKGQCEWLPRFCYGRRKKSTPRNPPKLGVVQAFCFVVEVCGARLKAELCTHWPSVWCGRLHPSAAWESGCLKSAVVQGYVSILRNKDRLWLTPPHSVFASACSVCEVPFGCST